MRSTRMVRRGSRPFARITLRIAAVVLAMFAGTARADPQEHGPEVRVIIGHPLPVFGLEGLWEETPLVVVATAEPALRPELDGDLVIRFQPFKVEEVLKDDGPSLGAGRLRIKHVGGELLAAGVRYVTIGDDPPPEAGERVVLFLHGSARDGAFQAIYGYFAIDETTGTVEMRGRDRSFVRLAGRSRWRKDEFFQEIKTAASLEDIRQATGTLVGCASDSSGASLPGTEVALVGQDEAKPVVTDGNGCYTLRRVPPGSYALEAKLAGFRTFRRENVSLAAGASERVDFSMCVAGLSEILWVLPGSYEEILRTADLVGHVRIIASRVEGDCGEVWIHTAQILAVAKAGSELADIAVVEFSQQPSSTEPSPYPVGSELIVALSGSPSRSDRVAGPFGVFVVEGNVVHPARESSLGKEYSGMEVGRLITELRRLLALPGKR